MVESIVGAAGEDLQASVLVVGCADVAGNDASQPCPTRPADATSRHLPVVVYPIISASDEYLEAAVRITVNAGIAGKHSSQRGPAGPVAPSSLPVVPQCIVGPSGEHLQSAIRVSGDRHAAGDRVACSQGYPPRPAVGAATPPRTVVIALRVVPDGVIWPSGKDG